MKWRKPHINITDEDVFNAIVILIVIVAVFGFVFGR